MGYPPHSEDIRLWWFLRQDKHEYLYPQHKTLQINTLSVLLQYFVPPPHPLPTITSGKPPLSDREPFNNPSLNFLFIKESVPEAQGSLQINAKGSIELIWSITKEQQAANIQTQKLWLNISYSTTILHKWQTLSRRRILPEKDAEWKEKNDRQEGYGIWLH